MMNDERLSALLERYLDSQLTDAERAELEETLRGSTNARAQFWRDTRLHSLLHEAERTSAGNDRVRSTQSAHRLPRWWMRALLLLLLTLTLAAAAWWRSGREQILPPPATPAEVVGQLRAAPGARWAAEISSPLLRAGPLELQSGVAEILLASGSVIIVQAPAKLILESGDRFTLLRGKLRAETINAALTICTPVGAWTARDASFGLAAEASFFEAHTFAGAILQPDQTPLTAPAAVRLSGQTREPKSAEPRSFPVASRAVELPIADGSFELGAPDAVGIPRVFGEWGGDHVEHVLAERGIRPLRGERMLRFVRAEPLVAAADPALASSEQWQLVDVRPWRDQLADGNTTLEVAAWFNRLPNSTSTRRFRTAVFACRGEPAQARELWRNIAEQALAHAGTQILADDDPTTWERAAAQCSIPADADYLIVTVNAIRRPLLPDAPRDFEGHYAEDVQLTLQFQPRAAP